MLAARCAGAGVGYAETLTGFKWIVRAGPGLAYGYEEALGYCVAPDMVRDKDGIATALLVADLAATLRADGRTLLDRLAELQREYGVHATGQVSLRVEDLTLIAQAMTRLRADPPRVLLGRPVRTEDLLPRTDGLRLSGDGVRVVVRPSGTEPKLKCYLQVVVPPTADVAAARRTGAAQLAALSREVDALLGR